MNTREKALHINLDDQVYGSFAEIGAGQEVVRWFFQAGGAAGTVAKSISAYDMRVSDAIYGDCERYVARERLESMLEKEYSLNVERLGDERGDTTSFFSFADTVSARNFRGTNSCHAWMGVRFQSAPGEEHSQIIIHVRMLDSSNALQQDAIGMVGVNLLYGATFLSAEPEKLLASLLEGLSTERVEVDMVEFSGQAFEDVDNRVMSLRLVQLGFTGAAMFAADGQVLQACEYLRKESVVVHRGRFRPLTHVNVDVLQCAQRKFQEAHPDVTPLPLMEMTMHHLSPDGDVCPEDFISRIDVLAATGYTVLISDFLDYDELSQYLRRSGVARSALAIGMDSAEQLFTSAATQGATDGLLEKMGRLIGSDLTLYVYPKLCLTSNEVHTIKDLELDRTSHMLMTYLIDAGAIHPLENYNRELLHIQSPAVLECIASNDESWMDMVPERAVDIIQQRNFFNAKQL
ncbi:MAG: hypothetical protein ACI9JM_002116 [Halioglobus sp.]|jgi:hypothetical protein